MALALVACNKNVETDVVPSQVVIEPVITRALSLNFNNGDKIGLDIIKADASKHAENACLTYADGTFSGTLKWYAEGGESCSLFAYYPFQETGFPSTFTVAADQSVGTESSDLMTATKDGVYPRATAELMVFHHLFSQIVVNITNTAEVPVTGVIIKGLIPTANVSVENGAVVDATVAAADITAEPVSANKKYCAVVVPQEFTNIGLTLNLDGAAALITSVEGSELRPGYSYTINVTISPDQVNADISGDIEDWQDGGELNGGDVKPEPTEPSFEEFDGYFLYDGLRYNTVTLSNGKVWMAEPLAYLPAGKTVSEDPSSGSIWYPYSSDGTNVTVLKDAASIKANGYLYSVEACLGVTLTEENFLDFEGVQGICPKGWHVPTRDEWFDLCGVSNAIARLGESGTQTRTSALFYDSTLSYAPVSAFNDAGFNFVLSGCIGNKKYSALIIDSNVCSVEEYYGKNRMAYVACSTANQYKTASGTVSPSYMALMTTFTSANNKGKVSVANAKTADSGLQLRCVRNAE